MTALIAVLDPSQQDFVVLRSKIHKSGKLQQLLNTIFDDTRGSSCLLGLDGTMRDQECLTESIQRDGQY